MSYDKRHSCSDAADAGVRLSDANDTHHVLTEPRGRSPAWRVGKDGSIVICLLELAL